MTRRQKAEAIRRSMEPINPEATGHTEITGPAYLEWLADKLDAASREGAETDIPEGSRKVWFSDTMARKISSDLRQIVELGVVICD